MLVTLLDSPLGLCRGNCFGGLVWSKLNSEQDFIKNIPLNAATSFYLMIPLAKAQFEVVLEKNPLLKLPRKDILESR